MTPHAKAVHMAMGPVRQVTGCETFFQAGFHMSSDPYSSQPPAAESMLSR